MTSHTDHFSHDGLRPLPLQVVSVQSQVVYGRVGNNVALPSFAAHGLLAAGVPTVLLSNTPHYPSLHGGAVPIDWFEGWLDDLVARDALRALRLIQLGYLGSAAQGQVLARWMARCLATNPAVHVHMDPVIGDHDVGVYVDPDLVHVYRQHLLPLADGLTPNSFELGQLTQGPVGNMDEVIAAARQLLHKGARLQWVAVTSAAPAHWPAGRMQVALVTTDEAQVIEHERVNAAPKGTGDLFSATLSARLLAGQPLAEAAHQACEAVVAAVRHTHAQGSAELLLEEARAGARSPQ